MNSDVHHPAPVSVSPSGSVESICCGGSARGVFGVEGVSRSAETPLAERENGRRTVPSLSRRTPLRQPDRAVALSISHTCVWLFPALFSHPSASVVTHGLISHDPSRKRDYSLPQFPVSVHRLAFGGVETGQAGGQDREGPDIGIRRSARGCGPETGGEGEQNLDPVRPGIHAGGVVRPLAGQEVEVPDPEPGNRPPGRTRTRPGFRGRPRPAPLPGRDPPASGRCPFHRPGGSPRPARTCPWGGQRRWPPSRHGRGGPCRPCRRRPGCRAPRSPRDRHNRRRRVLDRENEPPGAAAPACRPAVWLDNMFHPDPGVGQHAMGRPLFRLAGQDLRKRPVGTLPPRFPHLHQTPPNPSVRVHAACVLAPDPFGIGPLALAGHRIGPAQRTMRPADRRPAPVRLQRLGQTARRIPERRPDVGSGQRRRRAARQLHPPSTPVKGWASAGRAPWRASQSSAIRSAAGGGTRDASPCTRTGGRLGKRWLRTTRSGFAIRASADQPTILSRGPARQPAAAKQMPPSLPCADDTIQYRIRPPGARRQPSG